MLIKSVEVNKILVHRTRFLQHIHYLTLWLDARDYKL